MAKTVKYKGEAYKDIDPELLKEYRRLADRADKRLLRLERLAESDKDFDKVLDYAYKSATEQARVWGSRSEKARFAIAPPTNEADIKLKIKDIEAFLGKVSSTKSGIVKSYKKRVDNLNKLLPKGSKKLTWQEYKHYFDKSENARLDQRFGYRALTKAFSIKEYHAEKLNKLSDTPEEKLSKEDKELLDNIHKAMSGNEKVKFTSDNLVNAVLKELYKL